MTAYVFDRILARAIRSGVVNDKSRKSRKWFRDVAMRISKVTPRHIMEHERAYLTNKVIPGSMYMFFYDPKHKKTLPYYDRFPLVFPLNRYEDGFLGINMHYLSPTLRAKLMDALYETVSDQNYRRSSTHLKISYQILKRASKFRWFKPCVKRYLSKHVRSRFMMVHPDEWDQALMLPVARFEKASQQKVWRDSARMTR